MLENAMVIGVDEEWERIWGSDFWEDHTCDLVMEFADDELALDAWERALELNFGPKDDAFFLQKMSQAYKRIGDETTSLICLEESKKILKEA